MVCSRDGAALQYEDPLTDGWLYRVRSVFVCGHSSYGPLVTLEAPVVGATEKRQQDRPCRICGVPLNEVRHGWVRAHPACSKAQALKRHAANRRRIRAWKRAHRGSIARLT